MHVSSGGTVNLTESSFKSNFVEIAGKIAMLFNRPILLNVQMANKFFGAGRVDSQRFLVNLALQARSSNVIATTKARVWRAMWAIGGAPGSTSITGTGKNSIWAVIEKQLCRERLLLVRTMDPKRVAYI